MFIVILTLIFVLGWPLEWVPIMQAAGIDLIWFCTLVTVGLRLLFPQLVTSLPSVN